MIFRLIFFLYIYYAFLAIWLLFFLALIYHMLKFGLKTFATFFLTFIFIAMAFFMLNASFVYIGQIDWSTEIQIFSGFTNSIIN